jgi:uncharacterized protein YutE (UPF0331/DUF86 family)
MTKEELQNICDEEFSNVDRIMRELSIVCKDGKTDFAPVEKAAVSAFIVNVYSGIENVLKQVLAFDRLDIEDSPDWHEKVLRKAAEIGILMPDQIQSLSKYLAFRNYFIYTYIFNINWEDVKSLADALPGIVDQVRNEVSEYLQTV